MLTTIIVFLVQIRPYRILIQSVHVAGFIFWLLFLLPVQTNTFPHGCLKGGTVQICCYFEYRGAVEASNEMCDSWLLRMKTNLLTPQTWKKWMERYYLGLVCDSVVVLGHTSIPPSPLTCWLHAGSRQQVLYLCSWLFCCVVDDLLSRITTLTATPRQRERRSTAVIRWD